MSNISKSITERVTEAANCIGDTISGQNDVCTKIIEVTHTGVDPFIYAITVFVLACFVGYYVVWKVTPALHTPLMAVTNAISSIIIVGAILAAGSTEINSSSLSDSSITSILSFIAVVIASINIFGGFIVTHRMLSMFKQKKR